MHSSRRYRSRPGARRRPGRPRPGGHTDGHLLRDRHAGRPDLSVRLAAPTEGTSTSFQPLGPVAVDLVAGITKLAQNTLGVTYKLDATPAAGAVTSATRTVIFTITGGV